MPLITCEDCGKEHSDQAPACPQCGRPNNPAPAAAVDKEETGKPPPKPNGCLIGCLGAFVLLVGLAIIGNNLPESEKADQWDEISAKVYCESKIKSLLRDPDSYRFESASILKTSGEKNQYGTARIVFRSKNGFGGYNVSSATCERYENNGEYWVKASLD